MIRRWKPRKARKVAMMWKLISLAINMKLAGLFAKVTYAMVLGKSSVPWFSLINLRFLRIDSQFRIGLTYPQCQIGSDISSNVDSGPGEFFTSDSDSDTRFVRTLWGYVIFSLKIYQSTQNYLNTNCTYTQVKYNVYFNVILLSSIPFFKSFKSLPQVFIDTRWTWDANILTDEFLINK